MNPRVEAAVIENGPLSILDDGLAYDRCQIGIVTNLHDPARFGAHYVNDTAQLFNVLRTQVDVVLPDGYAVLNADCPEVAQMASLSDGGVILSANHWRPIRSSCTFAEGGKAVIADGTMLRVFAGRDELTRIAMVRTSPAGRWQAAAVAAAWGVGIELPLLKAGIEGLPEQLFAHASVQR